MLNKDGIRELVYVVQVDDIFELPGYDRVESALVGGWRCIVPKGQFQKGSLGIYFEIDSKVPADNEAFAFLEKRHYKVKTQKMCKSISQGLLMAAEDLGGSTYEDKISLNGKDFVVGDFLTKELKVVYAVEEDNKRKGKPDPNGKYKSMMARHPKLAKSKFGRWAMKHTFMKKILFVFLGKKKDNPKGWPVGKFPGVSKTDQERCENMTWVLNDKEPYIVTQKCDGSSGTYILERKGKNKFEFYVCSRNVRMKDKEQECFYGTHNYYWEVADKYDIENKMKQYLNSNPDIKWVCWQGEICAPGIQKNPHFLKDTHFYCFHWTDSKKGRLDLLNAKCLWDAYDMEVVPIVDTEFILPDDFEEFKLQADGDYDLSVSGDGKKHPREGFVYYKVSEPTFSFKNVSRKYLLNH